MSDACIIGVQRCGCITLIDCEPDPLGRQTEKALARIVRNGGQAVRTTTEEARQRPYFLQSVCPHDPKGWEPVKACDPDEAKISFKRVPSRDLSVVYINHRYSRQARAGEVRKRDGAWWATEGWFNYREAGAHHGDDPCEELGPFVKQRYAAEALRDRKVTQLVADAKRRYEEREAEPYKHGPKPTKPVPPFKPGEVWQCSFGGRYLILNEPEELDYGISVRVRSLDRPHVPEDNYLLPSWTNLGESMFAGMTRVRTVDEAALEDLQHATKGDLGA